MKDTKFDLVIGHIEDIIMGKFILKLFVILLKRFILKLFVILLKSCICMISLKFR